MTFAFRQVGEGRPAARAEAGLTGASEGPASDPRFFFHERREADRALFRCSKDGTLSLCEEVAHFGCPFCGGRDHDPHASALGRDALAYRYVRCRACEIVYPWPRLCREVLAARTDAPWLNRYLEGSYARRDAPASLRPFPRKIFQSLAGRRVLEVGPGPGDLLDYLESIGAEAVGVEPNSISYDHCRRRGLKAVKVPFDAAFRDRPEAKAGFDAVLFMESVYHLFDLRETFETARALLRGARGKLILRAFDIDSALIRFFPAASAGIDGLSIPVNASARTYARLLERCGFRVTGVYPCPADVWGPIGLVRNGSESRTADFFWRASGRVLDWFLRRACGSRNFVLVAENA